MLGNSPVLVLGTAGNELARVDAEPALAEEDKVEDCRAVVQDKILGIADVQAAGRAEDTALGNVGCLGRGKVGAGGIGLVQQQSQDDVLE